MHEPSEALMIRQYLFGALLLCTAASSSPAHYNMLLPASASAKKGEEVVFIYQWGHPYEHELFDAPKPEKVNVLFPDGETHKDLTATLEAFKQVGGGDKRITTWRFKFTPQQRGDHTFFLETPPIWLEPEKEFVQDIVRVNLHVQTQNGWDNDVGEGFRLAPVTRPYGLLPHMVFQAQVLRERVRNGHPEIAPHIEIERYNAAPPKELPADELITFKTRFDPNGIFTFAFPEAGWWSFTAQRDGGMREHKGKEYPVRQRLTLWVHVEDKK
jgi:cobalt/nickel transport protein